MTTATSLDTALEPLVLPEITRTTLALFAGASGDHNPIHIDIDVARAAGLDDVFAHGMLLMAYLGRLLTATVPIDRIRGFSARFVAITPVKARATATGHVSAIEVVDGEQRARISLNLTLDDGTLVVTGDATVAID